MSFPNLFDQFLTKKHVSHLFVHVIIWFHQLSHVFPIYFSSWSLQFFCSSPKFSQPIRACYHWVSSVFPPICWDHHDVSSVLVVRSFIVSLDFISFPHQSLHCTVHFHQFSPTYLCFLSLVTRFYPFSPTTCSSYHWHSSFLSIHSLILSWDFNQFSPPICSFLTRFHQFSPPPGSFNHWNSLVFSISSFYPWISSCCRPIAMCVLCILFS